MSEEKRVVSEENRGQGSAENIFHLWKGLPQCVNKSRVMAISSSTEKVEKHSAGLDMRLALLLWQVGQREGQVTCEYNLIYGKVP